MTGVTFTASATAVRVTGCARTDDDVYHQRSNVELVIRILKQRYGDRLRARTWYGQFRELAVKVAVKNIDTGIGASHC